MKPIIFLSVLLASAAVQLSAADAPKLTRPLTADSLRANVQWKGKADLSKLAGKPVCASICTRPNSTRSHFVTRKNHMAVSLSGLMQCLVHASSSVIASAAFLTHGVGNLIPTRGAHNFSA